MLTGPVDMEVLKKWRKYMLLLATQIASMTYAAGLIQPPVLVSTYLRRHTVFLYCNDAAFVASLVAIMVLLDLRILRYRLGVTVFRSAMTLDLLAIMAAFAAGSCRDVIASVYVSGIFAFVLAFYMVHLSLSRRRTEPQGHIEEEHRKLLLLLATFTMPLTYGAGLAPPGGFWSKTEGDHRADGPLLHDGPYKIRYDAFFYANASSLVASLAIITLVMSSLSRHLARSYALPVCVLVELLGLSAAFAAGSCRWITPTVYIVSIVGAMLLYIVGMVVYSKCMLKQPRAVICRVLMCANLPPDAQASPETPPALAADARPHEEEGVSLPASPETPPALAADARPHEEEGASVTTTTTTTTIHNTNNESEAADKRAKESRSLALLLGTLQATVTYQAGLSPPGGVWPEGGHDPKHHLMIPGNPVLLDMHPTRYKAFYHCNTAAFLASLVVIIIVQSKDLSSTNISRHDGIKSAALNTVMILGLFGLMGGYVAGSCVNSTTTIYVVSLAVVVFAVFVTKFVSKLMLLKTPLENEEDDRRRRKRKSLLQFAVLAATLTYQTGLNPPGGYDDTAAGDPVLLRDYWVRYQVFFYCSATGFMASVAVILLLVNQTMSRRPSIYNNVLHVCVLVGLLGFVGAYAAGSYRKLLVFALVAAFVAYFILQFLLHVIATRREHSLSELSWPQCVERLLIPLTSFSLSFSVKKPTELSTEERRQSNKYLRRKDVLMLLGILGASVTYQAGLAPPGGTFGDGSPLPSPSSYLVVAGDPILQFINLPRYQAFFYCNATSFVASFVLIVLLLVRGTVKKRNAPLWAMEIAVVLDQLGLLGAYAAGSSRDAETSTYVIIALVVVVVIIFIAYLLLKKAKQLMKYFRGGGGGGGTNANA